MTTVVQTNVLLRQRGLPRALAPRRRRLSTIMRQHAPANRRAIPLVFRQGEEWRLADKLALDRAARLKEQYRTTLVGPRDTVVIMTLPAGGGTGTAIGLTLAAIALTAVAGPAGATASAAFGAAAGFAIQAGLVVGAAALAYAAQRASAAKKKSQDSFYGVTGGGNLPKPGDRKPLIYGRCWTSPPLSQKDFFIYNGSNTTLFKRLTLGVGKFDVEEIRIGDSTLWTKAGGVQAPFNSNIDPSQATFVEVLYEQASQVAASDIIGSDEVQGQELPRPGDTPQWTPFFRLTPQGIAAKHVVLNWQWTSLTRTSSSGKPVAAAGGVNFQAQQLDPATGDPTGPIIDIYDPRVAFYSTTAVHQTVALDLPSEAEWSIRAQNAYPVADFTQSNAATWDGMFAFLENTRVRPKTTEIVIRIAGTKGLPITSVSDVEVLATRVLPVWNGSAWIEQPTRKAVWAYADLIRSEFGLAQPSGADLAKLLYYANRSDIAGFDEFNGILPSVSSFWDAASEVLAPLRAEPVKVGTVYSFVRDESAAEAGGRHVVTRRQILRDSGSAGFEFSTDETTGGDVIVEFNRGGDPKRPDEVRQDKFDHTRTPKRYRINGITDGDHALQHARWLGAIDVYRGATRKVTTEWGGRLIYPGTHLLSDLWFLEGKAVVGVAGRSGNTLTLDATPDIPAGATTASIRTRAGREWGLLNAVFDGNRTLALNGTDVATASSTVFYRPDGTAYTLTLAGALASETQDPTTVALGDLVELQETYIARSAIPSDEDHVDVDMVLDDPRVWQILDEAIVAPPAPVSEGPIDPLQPIIPAVHARCDRIETGIQLVWSVSAARGSVSYSAELSYDAGGSFEPIQEQLATMAGTYAMRQSDDPVTFRARAFGKTGLPGPWVSTTFTTVAPSIDGSQVDLVGLTIDHLDAATQALITGTGPGSIYAANQAALDAEAQAAIAVGKLAAIRQALLSDPAQRNLSTDVAVRSLQDTLQSLAEIVADAQLRLQDTQGRLVEIGVEQSDGVYKIAGLAVIDSRVTSVSLTLDALSAKVSLIADAAIDGDFDGLLDQITTVGQTLDALQGTLTQYVKQVDFGLAVTRVTNLETNLDAANAAIDLKASQAVVTALGTQVSSAQATVSALSGVVLQSNIGQFASDNDMRDQTIEYLLARMHQLEGLTEQTYANASLALNTKIDDQGQVISTFGITLTSVQQNAAAQYASLTQTIAAVDSAQTIARQALASQINDPSTGLAKTRADLATEASTRSTQDSALSTLYSGLSSQVNNPSTGLAAAFGAIASEATTRSTADSTLTTNLSTLSGQVNNATTGLPATVSKVTALDQTVNTPTTGLASRTTALESTVNNPTTGLPATRATVTSLDQAINTPTSGLASRTTVLEATVNGAGGTPSLSAQLGTINQARIDGDTSLANSIATVDTKSNYGSANGSIYFGAESGPAGSVAAYRLRLVSNGAYAGFTMLAMQDGTARTRFDTDYFDIVNSRTGQSVLAIDPSGYVTVNSLRVLENSILPGVTSGFAQVTWPDTATGGVAQTKVIGTVGLTLTTNTAILVSGLAINAVVGPSPGQGAANWNLNIRAVRNSDGAVVANQILASTYGAGNPAGTNPGHIPAPAQTSFLLPPGAYTIQIVAEWVPGIWTSLTWTTYASSMNLFLLKNIF